MYDYDAKNHLNDLRREADDERIARQVEVPVAEPQPKKVVRPSIFTSSVKLLTGAFAR